MTDLKDVIKNKDLVIGTEITLKKLRAGALKSVYIAKNCPLHTKELIEKYASMGSVELVELDIDNAELGVRAKKPYSISVLAL